MQSFATLAEFDLSRVRERLLENAVMPSTWVDEAIFEFRRYLGLHIIDPTPRAMCSKPVDEVWHCALLFSRLYAELCATVFGRFMHHEPAQGHDADAHERGAAACADFLAAYRAAYGEPGRLWR